MTIESERAEQPEAHEARPARQRRSPSSKAGRCASSPSFDLGHFLLHDGETLPWRLFDSLLAGYGEVVPLEADYQDQVRRSAILLGLRQLCRWISPGRGSSLDDPAVVQRARRLIELLDT